MSRILCIVLIAIILSGCAKIVSPDGGDKDITPPADTLMSPPFGTTRFNTKSILIEFDEYVQLNDIYNQLVISPPLAGKPIMRVKGKNLIITFEEDLLPDVTYTMSFGDGVTDITEGNPADELTYVFSTGKTLDSLSLEGTLRNEYTGEPMKGVKVMMYSSLEDSMPLTTRPYYITRSNEKGDFTFSHLKEGTYSLFALSEQNQNYLYDDVTESIAFLDSAVVISPDKPNRIPTLKLSTQRDTVQYFRSYRADETGYISAALNIPWNEASRIQSIDSTRKIMFWPQGDSLFIWPITDMPESVIFSERSFTDTLFFEDLEPKESTLGIVGRLPASLRATDSITVQFTRPLSKITDTLVHVMRDSTLLSARVVATPNPYNVAIEFDREPGKEYKIKLFPGAVESREEWGHDTLSWKTITHKADYYGTLNISMQLPAMGGHAVVFLMRNGEQIAHRVIQSGISTFTDLLPGSYTLMVIDDRNGNEKWDPADYGTRRQPEQVWNFREAIEVRSNWVMDIDYIFSE